METMLVSPAKFSLIGFPTIIFSVLIPVIGIALFFYIMTKRFAPFLKAAPDTRFDRMSKRIGNVLKIWLCQWRHPRYMMAGVLHIIIFAGFLTLSIRSISLVIIGVDEHFVFPGLQGFLGHVYNAIKDYAATCVLIACIVAAIRRGIFRPARYDVPEKYGHGHTGEALFVLGLISLLMISESVFDASMNVARIQHGACAGFIAAGTLAWVFKNIMLSAPQAALQNIHLASYYIHDLCFFFFLCFLPMGKHFHVITSVFNVFFMRIDKGNIKPVRHGVDEEGLDNLESFGIKKLEDFTWKHILDFYTCADCGRCSDHCPANAAGRPLSPRFISIKGRDKTFENYPLQGQCKESKPLMGDIYEEDEVWSCTTCGACEQECPLGIEYIDKIVDLRRGLIDDGTVPQSLQKPLKALEKRGNPWGIMEKKRAEWTEAENFAETCKVKILEKGETADNLYFVDSISSFDDRMQDIARAVARVLTAANIDFGILGKAEIDSGNEVRRFGEEMLFLDMKKRNTQAILDSKVKKIITADPHAFNTLKNDYRGLPPVEHISQVIIKSIKAGKLPLSKIEDNSKVYTYHDPCYLGRHNNIYEDPRNALDAIKDIKRVDMPESRDRSFCCGGGGLMLFYEPEEETRMGVLRVKMAEKAGANVIVTACPFCLVNIEDAIKVAGMEGKIEAIDLTELIEQHLVIS